MLLGEKVRLPEGKKPKIYPIRYQECFVPQSKQTVRMFAAKQVRMQTNRLQENRHSINLLLCFLNLLLVSKLEIGMPLSPLWLLEFWSFVCLLLQFECLVQISCWILCFLFTSLLRASSLYCSLSSKRTSGFFFRCGCLGSLNSCNTFACLAIM